MPLIFLWFLGSGGREATTVSSLAIGESMFGGKDSTEPNKEDVIDTSLDEERILKVYIFFFITENTIFWFLSTLKMMSLLLLFFN